MTGQPVQRLRLVFCKGAEIKYISHLDLMRTWERALRRAELPLAHSQGFNPRPRLFFAAALPVGFTGRAEMLDVLLERRLGLHDFAARLKAQLPVGLWLESANEVPMALPPLPGQVMAAEYEVLVETEGTADEIKARLAGLLAMASLPRHRQRPGQERAYDLRPLIQELWFVGWRANLAVIGMRLQADPQGTGRPDEVMAALGLADAVCGTERLQLFFHP
jgi:radical SAM-linked protein